MELSNMTFRRKFSVNLYKNLRLPLGEMSLCKDWVNDKRGNPYPGIFRDGDVFEKIENARYKVSSEKGGEIVRFVNDFCSIGSYEFTFCRAKNAKTGFYVYTDSEKKFSALFDGKSAFVSFNQREEIFDCNANEGDKISLTFRTSGVSIYIDRGDRPLLLSDIKDKFFNGFSKYDVFTHSYVAFSSLCGENACCEAKGISSYLCGGISQADIRPMKYEDGSVIFENGRIFLTVSSRLESVSYQSIVSWNPTLCDFKLEGAFLFDVGDGICSGDVASSVVYDRREGKWYIWMCSFSHGHILARSELTGDPRYGGIQIVDVKLMKKASEENLRTDFVGFDGDEDPDLAFIDGKWNLTVCRLEKGKGYYYYRFVSDLPLDGFVFADKTPTDGKTGGMFTKICGKHYFVCGSDFNTRARYDIYKYDDFSEHSRMAYDFDDGGFRGWGSTFAVNIGNRMRFFHITFDRHNGSEYNWSYGNIYVYEAREYLKNI